MSEVNLIKKEQPERPNRFAAFFGTLKYWYDDNKPRVLFYFIILLLFFVTTLFKYPSDWVSTNLRPALALPFVCAIIVVYEILHSMIPNTKAFDDIITEAKKIPWIKETFSGIEENFPRSRREIADSTKKTLNVIADHRRRLIRFHIASLFLKVGCVVILLTAIIKVLVIVAPANVQNQSQRFGIKADSHFSSYLVVSIVSLASLGHGALDKSDFSENDSEVRNFFLMTSSILSISLFGLGINLLAGTFYDSSFMNHIYHAIRTYYECGPSS